MKRRFLGHPWLWWPKIFEIIYCNSHCDSWFLAISGKSINLKTRVLRGKSKTAVCFRILYICHKFHIQSMEKKTHLGLETALWTKLCEQKLCLSGLTRVFGLENGRSVGTGKTCPNSQDAIKIVTTINNKWQKNKNSKLKRRSVYLKQGSFTSEMEWAPLSAYFGALMTQL